MKNPRVKRKLPALASAVGLISVLTLLSRIFGFGRWLTQSAWVGTGAFANAYSTANQLPTVLFEVVAGGALAGVTIPILAGPIADRIQQEVQRVSSALITWALVLLTPVGLAVFLLSPWIGQVMPCPQGVDPQLQAHLISVFLQMFALQVPLYGLCVVGTGILQAHEKFLLPALGPLLNSLVVIATYAIFGYLTLSVADPAQVAHNAILILGWGTTAGVAAMSLPLFIPIYRLGIRWRPTLHLGQGRGRQALRLAGAGVGSLIAQQFSVLVIILVTRTYGGEGSLPIYQYSQSVYMLPYAVLAVPIATAMFPRLSSLLHQGGKTAFNPECAASTRMVTVVGMLGSALLAALALPVTDIFTRINPVPGMLWALVAMAPGIVGYGLVYHVSRVLYALGGARQAVIAASAGWITVAAFSWGLGATLPGLLGSRANGILLALGISQSVGMSIGALGLLIGLRQLAGRQAISGVGLAALKAALLALVAGVAGWFVSGYFMGLWPSVIGTFAAAAIAGLTSIAIMSPLLLQQLRQQKRGKAGQAVPLEPKAGAAPDNERTD
ncbi:murein biosynthesis integral membrane protein MurJ [Varibaculum cambriense]|uniref:murein biosynthesis integral membrane protein MurJ n=1 Tax=Varibaculum cambriense TaxID=184870 RepID=UPI002554E670|nr:lipid II flippase MurJ [Varibaculum cambriense]MDK8275203.1 lipid II flippase MurJ [Varibaculum cambriense]